MASSSAKGWTNLDLQKYTSRVIEAHTVYSSHLEEDRTLKVYLPPDYNPEQSYPVLYCHDGLEFFTHGRIATIANRLIDEGTLRPLFIVGIAVQMKTRNDDYAIGGRRHDAYVKFVAQECVPFIESRYSIAKGPASRFMAGISLGATASLSLHMNYPEWFGQLILFSGAFYPDVQEAARATPKFSDLHAFMLVGEQETAVETPHGTYDFHQYNQAMRDVLRLRGAQIEYGEAEGTHIWGFWQKHIPESLIWLEQQRLR
jgi:enterochelin esterase-like enzyme